MVLDNHAGFMEEVEFEIWPEGSVLLGLMTVQLGGQRKGLEWELAVVCGWVGVDWSD